MMSKYEEAISLSVCSKDKYILIEIRERPREALYCSRMMVFRITEDNALVQTNCIDVSSIQEHLHENIPECKFALECFGYVGRYIIWVGLSHNEWRGVVQIYAYNTETDFFGEL